MIRKIIVHIICLLGLCISNGFAQSESDFKELKFKAHPKHQSELGISVGNFIVLGEILPQSSWGAGLHYRKAIDYAFSWRLDALYGVGKGLEPRNAGGPNSAAVANSVLNGSLNNGINYTANDWYHNYQTKYMSLTIQGVWSLNSFNFKKQTRKTNIYILGGFGVNSFKVYYDAKNSNGVQYDFDHIDDNLDTEGSRADRKTVKNKIKSILDGDYETRAEIASGRHKNNDPESFHVNFHANTGIGISFKVNENFNIAIEQQLTFVFGNDANLLDGYRWRAPNLLTQNNDVISYTSVSFNFNIGKKEKRSEPLWWVSPLSLMAEDLAEVKARPVFDTTDNDNDGVIDILDEELDTPEGFAVDTKGVQLDSDSDGIVDGNDKEPYSPPGYNVDADGIAQVPTPDFTNKADINRIVDEKLSDHTKTADAASDWYLSPILFDLNSSDIKPSEIRILRQVVYVMKLYPNKQVVVVGHSDHSSNSYYSDFLSYNRAKAAIDYFVEKDSISRDRFILNWRGERNLLDSENANEENRRVEFRIATNETEEDPPDYPDRGKELAPPARSVGTDELAENDVETKEFWKLGYDPIPPLPIDTPFYTFKLEIVQGEDAVFEHLSEKAIGKEIKGEISGDKMAIEFKSPGGAFEQIATKGLDERNISSSMYWTWNVTPSKSGNHLAQVLISTQNNNDTTYNLIHDENVKFEIVAAPIVIAEEKPISLWLLIPATILFGAFIPGLIFFFYRRKEKSKAEEKERIFPQRAEVFLEEVKHIIGDGNTDIAFQKMLRYFDEQAPLRDDVIQLRAQYQRIKKRQEKGQEESSDDVTLNRIERSLIQLINESKENLAMN